MLCGVHHLRVLGLLRCSLYVSRSDTYNLRTSATEQLPVMPLPLNMHRPVCRNHACRESGEVDSEVRQMHFETTGSFLVALKRDQHSYGGNKRTRWQMVGVIFLCVM